LSIALSEVIFQTQHRFTGNERLLLTHKWFVW
jgi:hypothetical protein